MMNSWEDITYHRYFSSDLPSLWLRLSTLLFHTRYLNPQSYEEYEWWLLKLDKGKEWESIKWTKEHLKMSRNNYLRINSYSCRVHLINKHIYIWLMMTVLCLSGRTTENKKESINPLRLLLSKYLLNMQSLSFHTHNRTHTCLITRVLLKQCERWSKYLYTAVPLGCWSPSKRHERITNLLIINKCKYNINKCKQ